MTTERELADEQDEFESEVPTPATDEVGAENVIDEFVEYFNARDLDAIEGMLSGDVDVEFLKVAGSVSALEAMEDFFVREPLVLATRGERGVDPVVGLWQPQIGDKDTDDGKDDRGEYVCIGYLLFECSDEDEPLITRVEYVEELDGDVLVEEPDDAVEIIDWEIVDD